MTLSITDPAFLFPGISLLFLAFTNRYLTLATVIRQLNILVDEHQDPNRERQISNLYLRISLIKYMQAFGIVSFLCCLLSMFLLIIQKQTLGEGFFITSLGFMFLSLVLSLIEVLKSGQTLKIELSRTHPE
jgi:hypothetical protein